MLHCAGIEAVTRVMESWQKHEGVQCNCCLALMALVRGTGSVCQVSPLPTALQNTYIRPRGWGMGGKGEKGGGGEGGNWWDEAGGGGGTGSVCQGSVCPVSLLPTALQHMYIRPQAWEIQGGVWGVGRHWLCLPGYPLAHIAADCRPVVRCWGGGLAGVGVTGKGGVVMTIPLYRVTHPVRSLVRVPIHCSYEVCDHTRICFALDYKHHLSTDSEALKRLFIR